MAISYKDAGVDVHRGYKAVELIKQHTKKTFDSNVLGDLGSFGGFYSLESLSMQNPVLVAGTDGVGTKLKYAFILGKSDTVGIDCVAMSVNDVVCQGARPLFFLDYIAVAKIEPSVVADIVKGVAEGCTQAGCALIGGETAEMPGIYKEGEFDLAGFCTGIVDKEKIVNGKNIKEGDVLVALASSGIHSNGFSLVRRLFSEDKDKLLAHNEFLGKSLGEEVLTPTRIYVKTVLDLMQHFTLKGIAHITGGGFIENIPRILPSGLCAKIDLASYTLPPVFQLIKKLSKLDIPSLYNTFNMGVGMVLCVERDVADKVVQRANQLGERAFILGEVKKGEGVEL